MKLRKLIKIFAVIGLVGYLTVLVINNTKIMPVKNIKHFKDDFFIGMIDNSDPYLWKLIYELKKASDEDEITITINSPGGGAMITEEIVGAMQHTKAKLHVIVDGLAASAGGIIAVARPDVLTIKKDSEFMVHYAISMDNGGQMIPTTDPATYALDKWIERLYLGLLTPTELIQIQGGQMVWITADQMSTRLCSARGVCHAEIG